MTAPARLCRGCSEELPPKHLRVQLAPKDMPWREARVHDLHCLLDFLQDEEEKLDAGQPTEVPWAGRAPA